MARLKKFRFSLELSIAEEVALKELCRQSECTKNAVIRSALGLYREVAKRTRSGGKVFIESSDGSRAEIVLVSLVPRD